MISSVGLINKIKNMELNKITFTNMMLDNLNNSISDNGKVDLEHFINLTNETYEAINYSRCCRCVKLGKELEFISFVKRDGSGTVAVGTEWNSNSKHPKTDDMSYLDDEQFEINAISLTHKTYIASGFNTWVVRLK